MKASPWSLVAVAGCALATLAPYRTLAAPPEPGTCPAIASAIKSSDLDGLVAELGKKPTTLNTSCIGTGMSAQRPLVLVVTRFDNDIARQISKKDGTLAEHNHRMEQMLAALVKAGAEVNSGGAADQPTPLALAAMSESPTAIQALLKVGADPNVKSADGQTALKIAQANGPSSAAIVELLKKAGATE